MGKQKYSCLVNELHTRQPSAATRKQEWRELAQPEPGAPPAGKREAGVDYFLSSFWTSCCCTPASGTLIWPHGHSLDAVWFGGDRCGHRRQARVATESLEGNTAELLTPLP